MFKTMKNHLENELADIRASGLFKDERVLTTPQSARVGVQGGAEVLNFCANNYLGLAAHPEVIQAARDALDQWGYGLSSVRFICGTQEIHKELEAKLTGARDTSTALTASAVHHLLTG